MFGPGFKFIVNINSKNVTSKFVWNDHNKKKRVFNLPVYCAGVSVKHEILNT